MNLLKTIALRTYHSEHLRDWADRCSLSKPRNQQIFAIFMAIAMGLTIIGVIGYSWIKVAFKPESDRDYRYIPFDMYDATMVCNDEMESRIGNELLRSYVDQHSTRLDSSKGMYRIYIKADVGTLTDFRVVDVYCFVDKWDYELSHYKQLDPNVKRVMTSDLKFFKD